MPLIDDVALGLSLPHRSLEPLSVDEIRAVATQAELTGFTDLWVTNNTVDRQAICLDSLTLLSYVAGFTTRIRLGVSVLVLPHYHPVHVAHQVASLDYLSGGRAILGAALGRPGHYADFQVPVERRVARFTEQIKLIKALWTSERVDFDGEFFQLHDARVSPRPVQRPHPPVWIGAAHPKAVRRAVRLGDGWASAGGSDTARFQSSVEDVREELRSAGRSAEDFRISKRVFLSVHDDPAVARAELLRWFSEVYSAPHMVDEGGVYGTPAQVREELDGIVAAGANHLVLNPVTRYREHIELLRDVVTG